MFFFFFFAYLRRLEVVYGVGDIVGIRGCRRQVRCLRRRRKHDLLCGSLVVLTAGKAGRREVGRLEVGGDGSAVPGGGGCCGGVREPGCGGDAVRSHAVLQEAVLRGKKRKKHF